MDFARYGFWVVKSSFTFSRLLNCSVFNIYAYMDDTTHKLMVSNDKMVFIVLQDFEHKILFYLCIHAYCPNLIMIKSDHSVQLLIKLITRQSFNVKSDTDNTSLSHMSFCTIPNLQFVMLYTWHFHPPKMFRIYNTTQIQNRDI